MTTSTAFPETAGAAPQGLAGIAPCPFLHGEDPVAFEQLFGRYVEVLRPADVVEEVWVRDIAELAWQVFRLRRLEVEFMNQAEIEGLWAVLKPRGDPLPPHHVESWAAGDRKACEVVDRVLATFGL